jgi:hypothetical protein
MLLMPLLLHTPKTHAKGVSNMLFINSTKYLFLERMVILLSHWARTTVVLVLFPLENVYFRSSTNLLATKFTDTEKNVLFINSTK